MSFRKFFIPFVAIFLPFAANAGLYNNYYVCGVSFVPTATSPIYGEVGYIRVTSSPNADCSASVFSYILAKGTTSCNGGAVDTGFMFSETAMMTMMEQLIQAKNAGKRVTINTYYNNWCQITEIDF